jgi:hypothetical protein
LPELAGTFWVFMAYAVLVGSGDGKSPARPG